MPPKVATLKGGQRLMAHDPVDCAPHPCAVHNPTEHFLSSWPQNWRDDANKMERICPHGIGHPDPDHVAYLLRTGQAEQCDLTHGCDGCCSRRKRVRDE